MVVGVGVVAVLVRPAAHDGAVASVRVVRVVRPKPVEAALHVVVIGVILAIACRVGVLLVLRRPVWLKRRLGGRRRGRGRRRRGGSSGHSQLDLCARLGAGGHLALHHAAIGQSQLHHLARHDALRHDDRDGTLTGRRQGRGELWLKLRPRRLGLAAGLGCRRDWRCVDRVLGGLGGVGQTKRRAIGAVRGGSGALDDGHAHRDRGRRLDRLGRRVGNHWRRFGRHLACPRLGGNGTPLVVGGRLAPDGALELAGDPPVACRPVGVGAVPKLAGPLLARRAVREDAWFGRLLRHCRRVALGEHTIVLHLGRMELGLRAVLALFVEQGLHLRVEPLLSGEGVLGLVDEAGPLLLLLERHRAEDRSEAGGVEVRLAPLGVPRSVPTAVVALPRERLGVRCPCVEQSVTREPHLGLLLLTQRGRARLGLGRRLRRALGELRLGARVLARALERRHLLVARDECTECRGDGAQLVLGDARARLLLLGRLERREPLLLAPVVDVATAHVGRLDGGARVELAHERRLVRVGLRLEGGGEVVVGQRQRHHLFVALERERDGLEAINGRAIVVER
mmetsp:Transcript_23361/g.65561  ORF Transcript_23361/g.65561 Transcript_23361/m.65561 type:complete len:567 (+) Transcript_23361:1543-3243(+)